MPVIQFAGLTDFAMGPFASIAGSHWDTWNADSKRITDKHYIIEFNTIFFGMYIS